MGLSFSNDFKYAAYAIARSGSDWNEIYVIDIATQQLTKDKIQWVKFSGAAWKGDGFYYSRYDEPKGVSEFSNQNQFQKVYYHQLGQAQANDQLIFEDKSHPLRYFGASVTENENYLIISASVSTSGNELYYKDLSNPNSAIKPIILGFDNDTNVLDHQNGYFIMQTNLDAPNKRVVKVAVEKPDAKNWEDVIPETENVLNVSTCAAATALTFGRFKVNLSQDNILDNGGWILCACWRWLGESTTYSIHLTPDEVKNKDDSRIVAKLFELYEVSDAVLAHNSLGFDHKVVQARAIFNGFPPLPQVKVLDTLQLARKYLKLPSNRLDAIGEFFGLGRKVSTGGISLWRKVQEGDQQAMKDMVTYCLQDVDLLYDIYLRTRQLGRAGSDFNAALYYDDDLVRCRVCGSSEVELTGRTVETSLNSFDELRCNECGAVHRHRKPKTSKEKRKSLLM